MSSPPRNESPSGSRKDSPPRALTSTINGRKESPPRGGRVGALSTGKRDKTPEGTFGTGSGVYTASADVYTNQIAKKYSNPLNSLDFLSQKNVLLRNNYLFNTGARFSLNPESFFDSEHFQTTLCVASLGDNLVATAGKDNLIRVFRVVKNLGKTDMKLLSILQYK